MDARIPMVSGGVASDPSEVRRQYGRLKPIAKLRVEERGWLLDVLNVVRGLNQSNFSLREVYAHEAHLSKLHPNNRHIQQKVRQQLQFLRDKGFLEFLGHGNYRLPPA